MTRPSISTDSSFNIYSQRPSSITPTGQSAELPAQEGYATTSRPPVLSCTMSDGEVRTDTEVRTDAESSDSAGSTLAQALNSRGGVPRAEFSDDSSSVAVTRPKDISIIPPLRVSSRALIKEYFARTETVNLIQGHPTIAFSQDQISSVLRIVADETARASFDMLENLIQRANELRLDPKPSSKKAPKRTSSTKILRWVI